MEAHVCVLEVEQGIEAQSVLFSQGGQDALGAGEASVNEDLAGQPEGMGAKSAKELAVLGGRERALIQQDFSQRRNWHRRSNIGDQAISNGNSVAKASIGRVVADELELPRNPGTMQPPQ
jgi:hypothetical protein